MTKAQVINLGDTLKIDISRQERTSVPEVIYAKGKSDEDLIRATQGFIEHAGSVFLSRLSPAQSSTLKDNFPDLICDVNSGTAYFGKSNTTIQGKVALVSGGTSDMSVLSEAASFLEFVDISTSLFCDVGVATLDRLLDCVNDISHADVVIVAAGMEAALPSVLAGLVCKPIIGIPTSTGYGASQEGLTALFGMLSSCSPGITVVNIDNGIGAGAAAMRILSSRYMLESDT